MATYDDALRDLILEFVPTDGSTIGNYSLMEKLQEAAGGKYSEERYWRVRDALVADGILEKGRGRGGSVRLADGAAGAAVADPDEEEAGEDDTLELTVQDPEAAPRKRKSKAAGKTGTRTPRGAARQVLSYRYDEKRRNNPHVGMVDVASDASEDQRRWAYDPHLDPALSFDIGRSRIEALIDDALASGDEAEMRKALQELRRLQEPYLNWTGKAERTSFEVDTVSLHVHERVDPAPPSSPRSRSG